MGTGSIFITFGMIAGGYFLGSISPSYIYCKWTKGVDIRTIGDKNPGAGNIATVIGSKSAFIIAFIDFCKGIVPVLIAKNLGISLPCLIVIGLITVTGHDWSIFLNFRGGKGTLTSLGASVFLLPFETLFAFSVWLFIHYIMKVRFIGSVITFSLILFLTWLVSYRFFGEPKYLLLFPLGILVLFLMRMPENIKNFFQKRSTQAGG
ncbi:hypothetical protein COY51_06370 [Candidatus Desantisbacteria bacterium CG_4_10_14_0_8_um_filter_39_17]|uniref:Glycerol-3-phosphate acyltransferase n=1 Tax=Candidatus Desantisbacteria bacterium CG_4_10_14_0_8_um_filter_39_17 TaxID=1974542 RepID=A0A2H9P9S8_9BACT|nr:MAG: hypothetical protein COY51_06370 [Candidatus Desantisbacteria bacterium CG_4_10_14_0_8_um_filter_39_17]